MDSLANDTELEPACLTPLPSPCVANSKREGLPEHSPSLDVYGFWDPEQLHSLGGECTSPRLSEVEMETHVAALQVLLERLTRAREGKESDAEAESDPTTRVLAFGLHTVLARIMQTTGQERHPEVLVTVRSLTYTAQLAHGAGGMATCGSQLWKLFTFWRHRERKETKAVLDDVTCSFRPGLTTLILGPPRSGKSTLMKAVGGRLEPARHTSLRGAVEYAGRPLRHTGPGEIKLGKLVGYVPQTDLHIPTLTVRETMRFAHACTSKLAEKYLRRDDFTPSQMQELSLLDDMTAEAYMAILGIRHVGDTIVGDASLRGISGGQRKRLTTGEVLATKTPVLLADEISTGLDSATTFDICNALRSFARCLRRTIVVSLLQPTPETFGTFDEVLVMAAGRIAYNGPREGVLPYFAALGFACPVDKDAAEFLQEVTLPQGIARYRGDPPEGAPPPWYAVHESEDFGPAWQASAMFQQRLQEDEVLLQRSKRSLDALPPEGFAHHKLTSEYTTSLPRSTWLCLQRQVLLTLRKKQATSGRMIQVVIVALIVGSLFFQTAPTNYNALYSVLYFSMLFMTLAGLAMVPAVIAEKAVIQRQVAAHFYNPLPYSFAVHALDVPLAAVEILVFACIVYWMVGLAASAADFFLFTVTIALVRLAMAGLFRVIAALSPTAAVAQAVASVVMLGCLLHSGFFLAEAAVKPWWIWLYWIDPLQYGMTSLSLIQFQSAAYSQLRDPAHPDLGTWGHYYLEVKQMPTDPTRLWLGLLFNAGFYLVMAVIYSLLLRFLRWPERFPTLPPPPPQGITVRDARPMPFTPCTLAWSNVCYDVDKPGKGTLSTKTKLGLRLLRNVSGFARPGVLTALMGSSGAGKTTLLDVLAGRKTTGRITGRILLNGQQADPITFSRFAGYVEQMDIHTPTATVMEALTFSALLRLPREVPRAEKEASVREIIELLNMSQLANCQIGTRGSGLSVEQVKRVTIGVEMAANPSILFLDEPTSGLDSMAADVVMDALKAVAQTGRTLVCTIHQPSGPLFGMFDALLLLMPGGKTVFFGETGPHSAALLAYFHAIPGVPPHDGRQNPATWMLDVIATEGIDFAAEYETSELYAANAKELEDAMQVQGGPLTAGHYYQATLWQQFALLLQKWRRIYWRTPGYNLSRPFTCAFIALIMGSIFFRVPLTDQQAVFTYVGLQYSALLFMGVLFANTIQGMVTTERAVFYRERAAHMYRPALLNAAAGLSELPYLVGSTLLFTAIFYWMVGLRGDVGAFFFWYLVFGLYVSFMTFFGWMMGCLLPTAEAATTLISSFASTNALLSGFILPKSYIPWWWRWLYYGLPVTYAFQPTVSSQFYCAAAEADPAHPGACATFPQVSSSGVMTMEPVWVWVRDTFDLVYNDRWMYVGLLVCFLALTRVGAALALSFVNHDKR